MRKASGRLIGVLLPIFILGCVRPNSYVEPVPDNQEEQEEEEQVTPSGDDWTATVIDEGAVYYSFSGFDSISGKAQEVFAIDIDLNNPMYEVKLEYTAPRDITSNVFSRYANAIAAMNANYETGSIYIRVDGIVKSMLPNSTIGTTSVPNWKSEAAFASDGERGVRIFYVGSQKKGEMTVAQQRAYYNSTSVDEMPYLISSAPMLIDNFNTIGESFCDYSIESSQIGKLNAEDPDRHQRERHPRSAVALTRNNHFIMFVVDGRTNFSCGMSARELTLFMEKWFNPQYALNMDGGGSSVLCIRGQGDISTNVVNYPCDNVTDKSKHDHDGLRPREAHFLVLKTQI